MPLSTSGKLFSRCFFTLETSLPLLNSFGIQTTSHVGLRMENDHSFKITKGSSQT